MTGCHPIQGDCEHREDPVLAWATHSTAPRARAFLPPDSNSPLRGLCQALECRVVIQIGDLDRAEESVQRLEPGNRASILRTRIDIARADFDQAREALARCVPATMRERLDVAVLAARIACGRKSDRESTSS